jgi:16S rRNA (guanine966-N2)-methyltransferase
VRIIAGEFRHRRLLANPGLTTRPITDRVKEILFERTQDLLVDRRIADVFAGTGSLGLESLSRGARSVDEFLPFDVVFFDPPYRMAASLAPESPMGKALVRLARDSVTAESALLFFRVPKRTRVECPPCWEYDTAYAISSMEIQIFRKTPAKSADLPAVSS